VNVNTGKIMEFRYSVYVKMKPRTRSIVDGVRVVFVGLLNGGKRMENKHEAPIGCKIRRFFTFSPSAVFACCTLGLMREYKHCVGCRHNILEIYEEGYLKGFQDVMSVKEWREEDENKEG
jgi:hypothetical protein